MASTGGDDDPDRRVGVGREDAAGDQGEGDDAHRLLRVVGAVGQRDQAGGGDLAGAVALGGGLARRPLLRRACTSAGWPAARRGRRRSARRSAGISTLVTSASPWTAPEPAEATVAPIRPPIRACEELEGRPTSQVSRFQRIAPTSAAKMTSARMPASLTRPPGDRLGDLHGEERADEVEHGGHGHRVLGLERAGRDGGGHRVGGVVETVREIEHESGDDHDREEQRDVFHLPRLLFDVSGTWTVGNLGERKMNWGGPCGDPNRSAATPLV